MKNIGSGIVLLLVMAMGLQCGVVGQAWTEPFTVAVAEFPFRAEKFDLQGAALDTVSAKVEKEIKEIVLDCYLTGRVMGTLDSVATFEDIYVHTLAFKLERGTFYVILLRDYYSHIVTGYYRYFDNYYDGFFDSYWEAESINLGKYENGRLLPPIVKAGLKLDYPEIDVYDDNGDGYDEFKVVSFRLNTTPQIMETEVFRYDYGERDVVAFFDEWFEDSSMGW